MFKKLKPFSFTLLFLAIGLGFWLYWPKELIFKGEAFGTTYFLKLYVPKWQSSQKIEASIKMQLEHIDKLFSTYRADSELARFNQLDAGVLVAPSDELHFLLDYANDLHLDSEKVWDPSIWPLIKLWGFDGDSPKKPSEAAIQKTLKDVGFSKLIVKKEGAFYKKIARVALDFSSVAKGYAIDSLIEALKPFALRHYFMDIGGEVRVSKKKPDGHVWRVGIQDPRVLSQTPLMRVFLSDKALATSGDYQDYFVDETGQKYTHIINPITGYPVRSKIASVSVIAPKAYQADGLATALFVMGTKQGLHLIDRSDQVEAIILEYGPNNTLKRFESRGFSSYTKEP